MKNDKGTLEIVLKDEYTSPAVRIAALLGEGIEEEDVSVFAKECVHRASEQVGFSEEWRLCFQEGRWDDKDSSIFEEVHRVKSTKAGHTLALAAFCYMRTIESNDRPYWRRAAVACATYAALACSLADNEGDVDLLDTSLEGRNICEWGDSTTAGEGERRAQLAHLAQLLGLVDLPN